MVTNRSAGSWVSDDELVTGEAVALELPPASLGPRILSGLIDLVIAFVLLIAMAVAWSAMLSSLGEDFVDPALQAAVGLIAGVLVILGVPVAMETLTRGKTIGKLALGLRAVRDDAGPITFRHALARGMVGIVEIYAFQGVPAVISALVSSKGKRLGDIAAGTYVIRDRVSTVLAPPIPMPAPLEAWARGADIGALPDGLATTVRSFLTTAHNLTPAARYDISMRLFAEVMTYVAPQPPLGAPFEAVLAAVIADRRRRDLLRLSRDHSLRARLFPPSPTRPTSLTSPTP